VRLGPNHSGWKLNQYLWSGFLSRVSSAFHSLSPLKVRRNKGNKAAKTAIVGTLGYYLSSLCVVVTVFLLYIWYPLETVKTGYTIQELSRLRDKLKAENNMLKLEYASLKLPQRIKHIAKKKLGMTMPKKNQVIILKNLDSFKLE